MGGASVSAGDDDPFSGLFLDVVEEVDEDRIDVLFIVDDGKAVAGTSFAIGTGSGFRRVADVDDGLVEGAAFAAEEFFGDAREVRFRLPRIGGSGGMGRGGDRVEEIVPIAVDILPFAVPPAEFFPLRLLET